MIDTLMIALNYVSMAILLLGFIINCTLKMKAVFTAYFLLILTIEVSSYILSSNLFLISISYYVQVSFIAVFILGSIFKYKRTIVIAILLILLIPMLAELASNQTVDNYTSYDRAIYNFIIVLLSMAAFSRVLVKKQNWSTPNILFLLAALSYFSIDFILALTTNYLINEHLNIVAWVWLFRLIGLLLFYLSVVNLSWKTQHRIFHQ